MHRYRPETFVVGFVVAILLDTPLGVLADCAVVPSPSLEKVPVPDPFFDDLTRAKSAKELKERAF